MDARTADNATHENDAHGRDRWSDKPQQPESDHSEPPLGFALFRVLRAMVFEQQPIPELNALPMAQLRLLWAVHFQTESPMKDLSERLGVSQSTVTQLADRLVRRNFVERLLDTNDRRIIRLRLSDVGREVLGRADEERRRMARTTWDRMNPQEQKAVLDGLEILGGVAEAVRAEQGCPVLPCLHAAHVNSRHRDDVDQGTQPQSVVDLMARRVRGK